MKYFIPLLLFISVSLWAQSDFDRAENLFIHGKYISAKSLFERHLKQHPQDLKTLEYLGDIQCHLTNWELALPFYKTLQMRSPKHADYYYKYGGAKAMVAKESNGIKALLMVDEIKSAFKKTLELEPKHIGARWALIELHIQLPALVGGSEKKAIGFATELLKISTVDGYLARGHIEEHYNRYATAEAQYKKAIEVGNSQTTYQKLANLYQHKMQQPQKARQVWAAYNEKNKS